MPSSYQWPRKELTSKQQKTLDRAKETPDDPKLKKKVDQIKSRGPKIYSDKEIENMSEDQLKEIIDSKLGTNTEKLKFINAWISKHYPKDSIDRISSGLSEVVSSIATKGIDGNDIITYVDKFLSSVEDKLDSDYIVLVRKLLDNNVIDVNTEWLYQPRLYDEDVKSNIKKIKALSFVSDNSNVRRYGLKNTDGDPLTIKDLLGHSAEEMLDIVDKAQTKGFDDETTFLQYARDNKKKGMSDNDFYVELLNKLSPDDLEKLKVKLQNILSKKDLYSNFMSRNVFENNVEGQFLQYLRGEKTDTDTTEEESTVTTTRTLTVKDWLDKHKLHVIDLFKEFATDIRDTPGVSKYMYTIYRDLLVSVINNKNLTNMLLERPIEDDTKKSVTASIISFLNSYKAKVNQENRKRRNEKLKAASQSVMRDVVDALATSYHLPRKEVQKYFSLVYKPGMTEEETISEILKLYGSKL